MEFLSLKRIVVKMVAFLLIVEAANTYYIYTQLHHIEYEHEVSVLKAAAYEAIADEGRDDFKKLFPDIWHVYVGEHRGNSYELLRSTASSEEIASSQRPIISRDILEKIIDEQKDAYVYEYKNGFDNILSVTVLKRFEGGRGVYGVAENIYENNILFSKSFYRAFLQSLFSLGVSMSMFILLYFWFDKLKGEVTRRIRRYKNTAKKMGKKSRFLFENSTAPIIELDKFGRIKRTNEAFRNYCGHRKIDIEGKSILEFLETEDDLYHYLYKDSNSASKPLEAVLKNSFGEMDNRYVKIIPHFLDWKGEQQRVLFLQDVTEVKKLGTKLQKLNDEMDEKVRKSEKYSRTILDAEPNIIWVQERNKIVDANRAFFDMFCASKCDITHFNNEHKSVFELFEKVDEDDEFIYNFPHKDPVAYLLTNRHKTHKAQMTIGGKKRIFKIGANYLMGNDHHFLNDLFIVIMIDITDAESLKNNEISFAKTNAIGQLAAGVTHEINTPLTYVKGSFEMLKLETASEDIDKTYVNELVVTIEEGLQRIENIVKTMKELNVKTTDSLEVTNLFDTIKTAINMIQVRAKYLSHIYVNGVLFDNSMTFDDTYRVYSQRQKLKQVWIIILNNALDEFSTSDIEFEKRHIDILLSKDEYFATVKIKDNAGGVPEEIMDKIFEPMFSTKTSSGMGLGLNITKKITSELKGSIEAYNENGGAVFKVRIPIIK